MDGSRLMVNSKVNRLMSAIFGAALLIGIAVQATEAADGFLDDPYSDQPVHVDIGEHGYAIPRNYLSHVRQSYRGRDIIAVLRALWPGLEPRSEENVWLWQRRHPTRQVRIHIEAEGFEGHQRLRNTVQVAARVGRPYQRVAEPSHYGLLIYERRFDDGRVYRHFAVADHHYLTPLGHPVVFQCNDYTTDRAKEAFDVELLCISEYQMPDGAWLIVHFFMVNLEHWKQIDSAARVLVNSFRRTASSID